MRLRIENFGVDFRESIREQDEIVSATGDGRIPFISSEDISQAAFDALTAEKSSNTDYYLVGPELHSFDEVRFNMITSFMGEGCNNCSQGCKATIDNNWKGNIAQEKLTRAARRDLQAIP